ncbi:Voltage-gated Ion Channel (VIC) Superfamily [Phytophthora cinnamomi]|uniref:Voltage-gated Ion Channel (VIC) Superfamily n=1 Tax=Phytophthora cinnamomi TaxID=4785 RepID=UPI0035598D91|nr:Voltage-gated Ion Channel (VIC) Superfamily [Phytophthora cinnamomi]
MKEPDELEDMSWAAEQPRRLTITVTPSYASRKSVELSVEDSKLVRRTSMLLASPAGPEAVLSQAEIQRLERLQQFGSRYFGSSKMACGRRRRDGRSIRAGRVSSPSLSSVDDNDHHVDDEREDENGTDVVVKQPRHLWPPWFENFRQQLRVAVKAQWFRSILYLVVIGDLLVLGLDNEYVTGSTLAQLDITFTVMLLMEIVLKVIAFGVWGSKDAYFQRSRYRFLQVGLVLISLISYGLPGGRNKWKVLRGLKTVRSLTLYSGLRRILKALVRAIPFLANVGTLSMFGLLAFSIFGLEAYSGSYSEQCTIPALDEDKYASLYGSASASGSSSLGTMAVEALEALPRVYCSTNSSCATNGQLCIAMTPPSSHVNFDSGLSSLFLVFLVVAQDGWVTDIMEPVVEATSFFSVLFFVAIVASMVFLVVNLFVAVITTAFMNFTLDEENEKEKPHFMGKLDPEMEETHVNMIMGATLVIEDTISVDEGSSEVGGAAQAAPADQPTVTDDSSESSALVPRDTSFSRTSFTSMPTGSVAEEDLIPPSRKRRPASAPTYSKTINCRQDYLSLLARMHQWQSLRNLTVETTMQLIQNGVLMEEIMGPLTRSLQNASGDTIETLANTAITPAGTPTSRKKAITMESIPDLEVLHFSTSTHALVMKNTESTHPLFVKFQRFVLSKKFDDFITVCILVNTLFLLVEYPNISSELELVLSVSEYLFGVIFLTEMIMRIVAMRGLRIYLSSTERIFDMVVVFCTTGNLVLNNLDVSFSSLNSVSSLRTLRVTRLMMKYEGTRKLIQSVLKSSRGVLDVVVFMLVFQVVNSIIGMQLFGGSHLTQKDGEVPRWNFDTFGRSFLTLLQVITGDQWSSIAYDAVDAANPHWFMVPFLILNFIVGQYVLLNLFIAVILENFSISEEEAYQLQLAQIIAIPKELDIYEKIEEVGVRAFREMDQLENVSNVKLRMFLGMDDRKDDIDNAGQPEGDNSNMHGSSTSPQNGVVVVQSRHNHRMSSQRVSPWKRLCREVAVNVWFSRLVQLMIVVSCMCLVLDEPHPEMSMSPPSEMFDSAITTMSRMALVVLFVEFVVKVGASGFGFEYLRVKIFHSDEMLGYVYRQTYIENKWNQLDLSLLLLAVADEIITTKDPTITASSVFRAGRVLRPLRMLNHNHEMKVILNAVARSLPHVGNVLALCFIVYIIFGVVGRSLFSEQFYFCNDGDVATAAECIGFYLVYPDGVLPLQEAAARGVPGGAILMPRVWQNARFSFDNIGAGFLTLLEMTSLKWVDKAFAAMDIAGYGKQPVTDASSQAAIFFVLYIYVGSLFVIRLFVGVLVEQFQRNNGTEILTESQKSWVDLEKFILLLKPLKSIPRPRLKIQAKMYDLCKHPYFSTGISIAIVLNLVLLLVSPRSDSGTSLSFKIIEIIFLGIFTLEATIKCIGLRQYYLLQPQGMFEVLILSGSIAAYFFAKGYHSIIQAGRIFRMMRVLRFVHLNRGIYTVYQTFRASLRPLGQIFFLMFMIYFIFAIVARQLFGAVRYGPAMNSFSNFRTFGSATLLLFQIMSGDDWHLTMTDLMVEKPFCAERISASTGRVYSDCGSVAGSALFFITYVTLVVFVFLNLFIAVILENFRSCYLKSDVCSVSLLDFEAYREVFLRYDVHNTGYFPLWQLGSFLAELPPGLRVDAHRQRTAFLQLRTQAQAQWGPAADGRKRPYFNELLRILCIHQLGIRSLPYEQQRDRVKQIFIYRAKVAQMLVDSYVKGYIQRWRARRARLAQLAMMRVDRSTSTSEDGGIRLDAPSSPSKSPTKDGQTQTDRRNRHHHHRHHHHRKHRDRSEERRNEEQAAISELLGVDASLKHDEAVDCNEAASIFEMSTNGVANDLEHPEADQEVLEEIEKPTSKAHPPHTLPPLVVKRARDPAVQEAAPTSLLGTLLSSSHSTKVHPS